MKIALLVERMDPLRGGRETYTARIADELARRGLEVTIICQDAHWRCDGVEVVPLGRSGWTRPGRMARFVRQARQYLARRPFDVTHAMLALPGADIYHPHGGTAISSAAAHLRRLREPVRTVYGLGSLLNLGRRLRLRLERQVVADPSVVCLCVSELVAEQIRRDYGRTDDVRVIFNGVGGPDADAAQRIAWRRETRQLVAAAPDEAVLLVVATNFELKGVAQTIQGFARWQGRGGRPARLVVVGRRSVGGYRRLAQRLGVGERVHFEPPTREIHRWYSAADALVLLSWYDPCSLVVLEAVRWHLPALTTVYNGAAEALAGGAGLVVASPGDIEAAASAMDDLADPLRRRRRIEACQQVEARFTTQRHVDELTALYRELAGRKGRTIQ